MVNSKDIVPHRMLYEVNRLVEEKRVREATDHLVTLLETHPGFAPAYNLLGYLYTNQFSDPRHAIPCFEKALKIDPTYPPIYFNLLVALNSIGDFNRIEKLAQEAFAISGVEKGKIYYCLAIRSELEGHWDTALKNYQNAILNSVVDQEIESYRAGIRRCDLKKSMQKPV